MPGISIIAATEEINNEKLRRRGLRDASDPLAYPGTLFLSYYRLNKEAFIMVLEKISIDLPSSTIPSVLQLATALRFLATGSFQRVIAKDVDLSLERSTVFMILWRVINAMENRMDKN